MHLEHPPKSRQLVNDGSAEAELTRDKVRFPDPASAPAATDSEVSGHTTVYAPRSADPARDQWPPLQIRSSPLAPGLQRFFIGESLETATWRLGLWLLLLSALAASISKLIET